MSAPPHVRATAQRRDDGPILRAFDERRMGANLSGPSLIRTRDWMAGRKGRYHLYFAHHLGSYIRMAYADHLDGPWQVHAPGVLDIAEMPWIYEHCASPDVHVDDARREIRMYFHAISSPEPWESPAQTSYVALSSDGLRFAPRDTPLGASYFRVWQGRDAVYALSLDGWLWRSPDGLRAFDPGPRLRGLPPGTRHLAVLPKGDTVWLAWSVIGDCPERIMAGTLDTRGDWDTWRVENVQDLLRPERAWEGAGLPLLPSRAGITTAPAHQLRDPGFFSEGGRDYLLYSVAGESGIAIADFITTGDR